METIEISLALSQAAASSAAIDAVHFIGYQPASTEMGVSTFHMLAAYSHLHADPDMVSKQQRLRLTPLSSLADEALAVYQTHRLPVRCEKPSSIYSLPDIETGFCVSVCVCVAGRGTVPELNAKARDRCSPTGQTVKHSTIHICGDPSAYHFYRQYSIFELSFTGNQDGPYRPNFERSLLFHTNHKKNDIFISR